MIAIKKILKDVSATIGVLATIGAVLWAVFQFNERTHSSEEMVEKAEEMLEDYDPKTAFGEYILDSIEEVETKAWRKDQEIKDSLYQEQLSIIVESVKNQDTLLRLNVRLSSEAKEAAENPH